MAYRFYCMALFHSQTRRHMINLVITWIQVDLITRKPVFRVYDQIRLQPVCSDTENTAKPVIRGHSKIDKTKILMTNGSLMEIKVLQNAPLEHSAILSICIKRKSVLENQLLVSFFSGRLRQVLLQLEYCNCKSSKWVIYALKTESK